MIKILMNTEDENMFNPNLKKEILAVVDNQIKENNPPCTKKTYQKLQEQGCSKQEAKEMIASVLLEELYDILSYKKPFNEKKYEEKLNELENDNWIFDDVHEALADENDEILLAKYKVYDAIIDNKSSEAVSVFLQVWDKIKKYIRAEFYKIDSKGNQIKPEILDVDDKTNYKYELFNWLQDIEIEFGNVKMHEEKIKFCKDILELFAWQEDSPDDYKTAIGESLNDLKRYKECDEWFEALLKEEPSNPNYINIYMLCLIMRNDIEKAKKIAGTFIDDSIKCTIDNEIMFIRAQSLYEDIGDNVKAKIYENKIEEFQKKFYEDPLKYSKEDYIQLYHSDPIVPAVKKEKMGRNDPCPCGSGKKYKKCCGRN